MSDEFAHTINFKDETLIELVTVHGVVNQIGAYV